MRLLTPFSGLSTGYLLAAVNVWGMGLIDLAIFVIIFAAVIAIVYVALRQFNIAIPQWVQSVFWIVIVTLVCVLAIKILVGLW